MRLAMRISDDGQIVNASGYIVYIDADGKRRLLHRRIYAEAHGAVLDNNTVIHHLNGVRTDNRVDNLRAMTRHDHNILHRKLEGKFTEALCHPGRRHVSNGLCKACANRRDREMLSPEKRKDRADKALARERGERAARRGSHRSAWGGELKAWRSECDGFAGGYMAASSRGRALMVSCSSMVDAGYADSLGDAMSRIRIRRVKDLDHVAARETHDGAWITQEVAE